MTDTEVLVYGMLMSASNLDKLVTSGLPGIVLDDLWFKCSACKNVQHSDGMLLLGVSLTGEGSLKNKVPVQSVRSFFDPTPTGIAGLLSEVANADSTVLRCVECASGMWSFDLEIPAGDTPEGWREQ